MNQDAQATSYPAIGPSAIIIFHSQ